MTISQAIRQSLILDEASRAAEVAATSATAGAASSTSGATTSSSVQREETVVSNKVPPAIDTSSGDDTLENVDSLLPVAPPSRGSSSLLDEIECALRTPPGSP